MFTSPRFPTLRICWACMKLAQEQIVALMGEQFVDEVIAAGHLHLIHYFVIDHTFRKEMNRHTLVPPL